MGKKIEENMHLKVGELQLFPKMSFLEHYFWGIVIDNYKRRS